MQEDLKDPNRATRGVTYYGVIIDILLSNNTTFVYPVFKCDWVDVLDER